ncbi:WD domain, G-beta repeat protein, partial [Cooperia oncophora]
SPGGQIRPPYWGFPNNDVPCIEVILCFPLHNYILVSDKELSTSAACDVARLLQTSLVRLNSTYRCVLLRRVFQIWSCSGWQPLRQLKGHDTKVMCVDISPDGKWIMSSAFDRTFKLWTQSEY